MSTDEYLSMWDYWCSKYGRVEVLRDYYPELLAGDPRLTFAVAQIENCEAAIDARMAELAAQEKP